MYIFKYKYNRETNSAVIDNIVSEPLSEEVKFMFFSSSKEVPKYYDDCAFFFSIHTSFIDSSTYKISIPRNELDNPHKDKFWNVYKEDFGVEIMFEPVD